MRGDRLARRRARQGPGGSHRYPEPGGEHCADYRFNYSLAIGGDGWPKSIVSSARLAASAAQMCGRISIGPSSRSGSWVIDRNLHRCPAFDFLLPGSLPLRGATSGPAEVGGPGAPHRIRGRLVRWIRKFRPLRTEPDRLLAGRVQIDLWYREC